MPSGKALGVAMSNMEFDTVTATSLTATSLSVGTSNITSSTLTFTSGTIGASAAVPVGFYGASVSQASALTAVSTGALQAISSGYGFATSAQGQAIITAVNSIITALKNMGITA